jgi:hypothetical protein
MIGFVTCAQQLTSNKFHTFLLWRYIDPLNLLFHLHRRSVRAIEVFGRGVFRHCVQLKVFQRVSRGAQSDAE